MNKKCIFIGNEWKTNKADEYRKIIINEISDEFSDSIVIGSLPSYLDDNFRNHFKSKNQNIYFLIFDLHNFFIYRETRETKLFRVENLVQYITDISSASHLKLLNILGNTTPIKPFFFNQSLQLINTLLRHLEPRQAFSVNTKSFEIESFTVYQHPLIENLELKENSVQHEYKIKSNLVNSSGRSLDQPSLKMSSSKSAGLIRMSEMTINEFSMPGNLSMVAWRGGTDKLVCGGTHTKAETSKSISLCESMERFQVMYHPTNEKLIFSKSEDLQNTYVNPQDLFYETINRQFDSSIPIYWTEAHDLGLNRQTMVPAQEIWFDNERLSEEHLWISNTTNGCAVGQSKEEAILFGILEVIERDAFLTSWYLRRKCKKIIPETIENEQVNFIMTRLNYQRPGYKLYFLDLRNDLDIPVVCALAVRECGKGPKFLCAVAARLSYSQACLAALKDIQNLLAYPPNLREYDRIRNLMKNYSLVSSPEDHKGLYMIDENYDKVNFFTEGTESKLQEIERFNLVKDESALYSLKDLIEHIIVNCRKSGASIIIKDITQDNLKEHNLHCIKAIGVDLFPMWYGFGNARIRITQRLKNLYKLYNKIDFKTVNDLNLEIHPFG
jgi:ribosomal protein S12 methylthiotransferase accessory factor